MNKVKILIVEDMALIALNIKNTLLQLGYTTTEMVDNYDSAIKSINNHKPDAVIIDIGLKGTKTGIDLATKIQRTYSIPFIYLTSDASEETIEKINDNYPYLIKPYKKDDLKVNLHKILHKNKTQNLLYSLANNYTYDTLTLNIYHKNKPIHLSPKEKLFLNILISGKNDVIPFNIVENHIWKDNPPIAENALRNILSSLRSKLEFLTIETVPSVGYKLISEN